MEFQVLVLICVVLLSGCLGLSLDAAESLHKKGENLTAELEEEYSKWSSDLAKLRHDDHHDDHHHFYTAECKDHNAQCSKWKANGLCSSPTAEMLCTRSCTAC
ncbi:unnamed protein product, partial [Meganyctiphanes norvegica]